MKIGMDEGATCNRDGCPGTIEIRDVENCSCHLSPPCNACVENPLICSECDISTNNDEFYPQEKQEVGFLPSWMRG
jgi:hypothetical protein